MVLISIESVECPRLSAGGDNLFRQSQRTLNNTYIPPMELDRFGPGDRYHTRLLGPPDLKHLQALFERGADYFQIATGADPARDEAPRAFVAGPPSKSVNDKRVVGVFSQEGALVGVLDALTDFPAPGEWTIGMLLLEPAERGHGLGGALLRAFEGWAASQGAAKCRTALVAHHAAGLAFLEYQGYSRLSSLEDYDAGARRARIIFLEKNLAPRGKNLVPPRGA
jgi:GNAT superfamily N-acetyltransferase